MGQTWILYRAFYGARKAIHVSTLAEVNETIENAKNVVNVVVLPPEAGDSGTQESNIEDVADSMEKFFEPAGELEVEEDFESNEKSEMALPSTRKKKFSNWKNSYNFDKTILIDVRFDVVNHFLGPVTTQGQRKVCKKKIQKVCAQNATFVSMGTVARLVSKLIILVANA